MVLNYSIMKLAMILCAGDMSSGFIPLKPVLDNREQLIEERLDYYLRIVPEKYSIWNERLSQHISDPSIRDNILCDIAFLVNADMISGAIPLKPVLLGRDEMIFQRFNAYVELILEKSSRFSFINGLSKSKNVEKIKESIIKIDPNKRRKGIKSRRR
ncbi:hypothetical protein ZC79_001516 [Salmonella enterica subsp. enterica]|nr:hypothetical protein [Salmonella enterica subsp. enterica]